MNFIFLTIFLFSVSYVTTENTCSHQCHEHAICTTFDSNEPCCKCNTGYIGNGENCFEKDESIIIRGQLKGHLNGIGLNDQELHAYVHTQPSDARNYIALGRVPIDLGAKITQVLPLAAPIHWLFAGDLNQNALNGFTLTGGVFSRQSDATFFDENGEIVGSLFIKQNFSGLYENSKELRVETHVEGNLPDLSHFEQVIYPDYEQEYEYSSQPEDPNTHKEIIARGSINYKLASINNQTQLRNHRIEHNERINFKVCKGSHEETLLTGSASTKVSTKRLTVSYTESEGQVRFSSANFIKSLDDQVQNACDSNDCSIFAECINDSESENGYYCQCKPGFDGDGKECIDINECDEGTTFCSPVAQCINLLGYYECKCPPPRVGDGRVCDWPEETNANDVCSKCDSNARCISNDEGSSVYCKCNAGFTGNGFECQLDYYEPDSQTEPAETTTEPETTTHETSTTRKKLLHTDRCEECSPHATCELQHESNGECCVCLQGYIGNGKYCLPESNPVEVKGKITGRLNNQNLDDFDLYSYVLTHSSDSRNFVAIGKVPPNLGGSFQVLISLVNPINWLFAGRNGLDPNIDVKNGFELTGGQFSRISTLNFFDEYSRQTSSVTIRQEFLGLDAEGKEIRVQTEIMGEIPNIDPDAQVVFKDYKQEYVHQSQGFVRSSGEISYEVTTIQNSQSFTSYKVFYSDDINYSECPHMTDHSSSTVRVNSKRVYITYTKGDNLVRFSSGNYVYPKDHADDPCETNSCSIYAECLTDLDAPNNYTCVCKVGFEGDGFNCYDVDECETGESYCDTNAVCYNLVGHFECQCRSPYKGDGKECFYDLDCRMCDSNAKCVESDNSKRCVCKDGFVGDGFSCTPAGACACPENSYCSTNYQTGKQECKCKPGFVEDSSKRCAPLPCNEYSNCNENAKCELTSSRGNYECKCLPGFFGDGYVCTTQTCDVLNNCDENARCIPDPVTLQYRCVCSNGYIGNGYECAKDIQSCNVVKNCHPNAECLHDERTNRHFCKCKPGFSGDGFQCSAINSCRNRSPQEVCDSNADCVYDIKVNDYVCKCRTGYEGNGVRGKCYLDESYGLFLVYAQGSSLHKLPFKQEEDKSMPHKNRIVYIPGQTAVGITYDCHEQYIYWSDVSGKVINRIRSDGSNYSVVLHNVKSAEGLAVDWISRNIYFTDSESRTIEVAALNGQHRKVLIKSHLSNPRGIAVDPVDGYIFWTDWNRKSPKIERANMDGTHRKVIVSQDLGVPNGLYFDQKRQEICWGDAKTKKIECVEKDGSNRRLVTQMNSMYPFDLTEVRSNIYWSDWSKKEVQNVDKDGVVGQSLKLSPGGNGRVYGIVAIKNSCPKGTNACDRTNGDCNQLCLPRPDHTRQCACSDDSNSECLKTLSNN